MSTNSTPREEQPKADCKRCSGSGVVTMPEYPGKHIPCPECFSAPVFISKLLNELIEKKKKREK